MSLTVAIGCPIELAMMLSISRPMLKAITTVIPSNSSISSVTIMSKKVIHTPPNQARGTNRANYGPRNSSPGI